MPTKTIFKLELDDPAVVEHEYCYGCGDCIEKCPTQAITIKNFEAKIDAAAKEKLARRFDELASQYDEWYRTPLGSLSDALEKEAVFSLVKVRQGELALDVRCGTGNYALELARKRVKVIGIDSSKKMLDIAITKSKENMLKLDFLRASAENLHFAEETFDVANCILMLEFANSPRRIIKEIFQVLKPSGRLIIGILNKYSLWTLIRRLKATFTDSIWKEAMFFDSQTVIRLLVEHGYAEVMWKSTICFPPINNKWLLNRFRTIERVGQRFFPNLCTFISIKCEKPAWRQKLHFKGVMPCFSAENV